MLFKHLLLTPSILFRHPNVFPESIRTSFLNRVLSLHIFLKIFRFLFLSFLSFYSKTQVDQVFQTGKDKPKLRDSSKRKGEFDPLNNLLVSFRLSLASFDEQMEAGQDCANMQPRSREPGNLRSPGKTSTALTEGTCGDRLSTMYATIFAVYLSVDAANSLRSSL